MSYIYIYIDLIILFSKYIYINNKILENFNIYIYMFMFYYVIMIIIILTINYYMIYFKINFSKTFAQPLLLLNVKQPYIYLSYYIISYYSLILLLFS